MIYNYYNILGDDIYFEKIWFVLLCHVGDGPVPMALVSKWPHTINCANTREVVLELCRHFFVCLKVENQQDNVYLIQEMLHLVVFYN